MIPDVDIFTEDIEEAEYADETYKIEIRVNGEDRINGVVDEIDAITQAIYLILGTERYEYPIYSWDYGIELIDLIGQPIPYVMSEISRRVEEALTQDDRIESVKDFEYTKNKGKLHVTFTVVSTTGNIPTELEVVV